MARIQESIEIKHPAKKVFDYTTDAKTWSKWQSILPEAEQVSPGPMSVGAITKGKLHMMGLRMKWTGKTTEYEPVKKYGKYIICGPVSIDQHNTYDPVQEGTKFTIVYDMKVGGLLRLLSPAIVNSTRKELKKSLVNLKNILETKA